MGTVASFAGNAFKRVPTGVHVGRCISVVDLGTQEVEFSGEKKLQHKVQIGWEVLGEDEAGVPMVVDVDGKEMPMTISKRYTLSLSDKANLRRDLEAWRGKPFAAEELKGFDIAKLLGAFCMLNVVEQDGSNGKTYSNISSITPLPRGLPKPSSSTPLISFDVDNPDMQVFGKFHAKLQETIQASVEWRERTARLAGTKTAAAASAATSFDDMDSDIPF